MVRRRVAAAVVAAVVCALPAACTGSGGARTPSGAQSAPVPAGPSVATAGGPSVAATTGPGGASAGDPMFPKSGNTGYDVGHYTLRIGYQPSNRVLTGDATISATATQGLTRLDLDLHGLTVTAIQVDGVAAAWTRPGDKLQITPKATIAGGAAFTVHIVYHGVPSAIDDPELGLNGWSAFDGGAIVQGEPQGASTWFPVNDTPADKAAYDITVRAPSALAVVSNGVLAGKTGDGGDTVWHWADAAPMASYLSFVVIGHYRVVTTSHDGLPVVYAVASSLPTSVDRTLEKTPQILDYLETWFGPYPFDALGGVVHADTRYNFALENQTRPVYARVFFGGDDAYSQQIIAHELTHEWFGDDVSVARWSDLWLNEGFATYAEWLWRQHTGAATTKSIFDTYYRGYAGSVPSGKVADPDAATLWSQLVYAKGAMVLEALRMTIGDTAFDAILKDWPAQHRYGNGDTAEFIALAERVSGKDLTTFFQDWLYSAAKPPYPAPVK